MKNISLAERSLLPQRGGSPDGPCSRTKVGRALRVAQKDGKHGKTLDQLFASGKKPLGKKDPALSPTEQIAKDPQSHEGSQLYRLRKHTIT